MSTDKMTPTPWSIWEDNAAFIISNTSSDRNPFIAQATDIASSVRRWPENAKAIVSAINNTYGAGINPEAVPELIKSAMALLAHDKKEGLFDDYENHGDGFSLDLQISAELRTILDSFKAAIEKAKL